MLIMEYLLFSYPNCSQCEELKKYLENTELEGKEYSLVSKEGKLKIREFLAHVKRDEKGAIVLPTLILHQNGEVVSVLNNRQELETCLKSRD